MRDKYYSVWTHFCKVRKETWTTKAEVCKFCGEKKPPYGQIKKELLK